MTWIFLTCIMLFIRVYKMKLIIFNISLMIFFRFINYFFQIENWDIFLLNVLLLNILLLPFSFLFSKDFKSFVTVVEKQRKKKNNNVLLSPYLSSFSYMWCLISFQKQKWNFYLKHSNNKIRLKHCINK